MQTDRQLSSDVERSSALIERAGIYRCEMSPHITLHSADWLLSVSLGHKDDVKHELTAPQGRWRRTNAHSLLFSSATSGFWEEFRGQRSQTSECICMCVLGER